jgi:hypothetical protein
MSGTPGWIVILGPGERDEVYITTEPVSGRVFTITATAKAPREAASLVRTVTKDFVRPGRGPGARAPAGLRTGRVPGTAAGDGAWPPIHDTSLHPLPISQGLEPLRVEQPTAFSSVSPSLPGGQRRRAPRRS